ncbi:hypothetical protein KY285_024170 [Solanum tuberosum]|nr:hypothetical protein KY285_024170 [Solanum tuberosum]
MSKPMGIRFHPTDKELINYLKKFFKDSFFKENNHILKEDFVVCRIKKKMDKEKNVDHVMDAQDGDVAGIIDPITTMEKRPTTLEVQEGHGGDDIRSDEFQKEMYRTFEDIPVDIPDDWL